MLSQILDSHMFMTFIYYSAIQGNISSKFSSKSEADASELLENLEAMFPIGTTWILHVITRFKYTITQWCVTRYENVRYRSKHDHT